MSAVSVAPAPVETPSERFLIDVLVEDPAWLEAKPGIEERAVGAATAALARIETAPSGVPAEICLMLANDELLRDLNARFRGKDEATNVLSFPAAPDPAPIAAEGGPRHLGDVALALGTVLREAAEQGKTAADHATHLIVHGVLHVMGYDHQTDSEAAVMEREETAILAMLGIGDPYASVSAQPQ